MARPPSSPLVERRENLQVTLQARRRDTKVHGDPMGPKPEGTVRLWFQNVNSLALWQSVAKNDKMAALRQFLRDHEIDVAGMAEVGTNHSRLKRQKRLDHLLRSETQLRVITGHNTHEEHSRAQYGGVAAMAMDQAVPWLKGSTTASQDKAVGVDATGLGRYCWLRLEGRQPDGTPHVTRVVVAYQPCRKTRDGDGRTVYQQHRRYFRRRGVQDCPRALFRRDLLQDLKRWRTAGDRIILMTDANVCLNSSRFMKTLRRDIGLRDLVRRRTGRPGPATFFRGSKQIDGILATDTVDCTGARFLPFGFEGVGDHRGIVIDVPAQSLIGQPSQRIVRPQARRLNNRIPGAKKAYVRETLVQMTNHKLPQQVVRFYQEAPTLTDAEFDERRERLDRVRQQCMERGEKKCRKLRLGAVEFSPELMVWRDRKRTWEQIRRWRDGGKISKTTIRRSARRCGIQHPLLATREEAIRAIAACEKKYVELKPKAPEMRSSHLRRREIAAEEKGNPAEAKAIRNLRRREVIAREWRDIGYATKEQAGGSVSKVEVPDGDNVVQYTTQDGIENSIMSENTQRFLLTYGAHGSPLLRGQLLDDIGLLGTGPAVADILEGTYEPPPDTDEFTKEFLKEIGAVATHHRDNPVPLTITKEDFQDYWKKVEERTSSSLSGLHFGHYKAAASSNQLSEVHALLTQVVASRGRPFDRWCQGLSTMLEKVQGVIRVDKLRAILLMEADFNFQNKLYMGYRLVQRVTTRNMLPPDQFGRAGHTSIEVATVRRLFFDISRQRRHNAALASVDAHTCYDRIVHSAVCMISVASGLPPGPIVGMLWAIQKMKFYLRTAFGDSTSYYTGTRRRPFMGLCQGNGAAPGGWLLLSSFLITLLLRRGVPCKLVSSISKAVVLSASFMYVDDADLPQFANTPDETIEEVGARLQTHVSTWGGLLRTTGGAFKPAKCFWIPLSWKWKRGAPSLQKAADVDVNIQVRGLDGTITDIEKLDPNKAKETMGVWQTGNGDMSRQVEVLQEKATHWTNLLQNGYLHRRSTWRAFRCTIWRSIQYVLPATNLQQTEAEAILRGTIRRILPKCGVNRNIPEAVLYASKRYQGLELPYIPVEEAIEQIRLLLMHYGTSSQLGKFLTISEQDLIIELGLGTHFFALSYEKYGYLATPCWLQHIWSNLHRGQAYLRCPKAEIPPLQREGDEYIMSLLVRSRHFSESQLCRINRCRRAKQVYSLADIVTGDGERIRPAAYTSMIPGPDTGSKYLFPREHPARSDWTLWATALNLLRDPQSGQFLYRLGRWIREPHLNQYWWYDPDTKIVFRAEAQGWRTFSPGHRHSTRSGCTYVQSGYTDDLPPLVQRATMYALPEGGYRFEGSTTTVAILPAPDPTTIHGVLQSWGNTWVWDHLRITDGIEWLLQSLRDGSALLVGDGSFQPQLTRTVGAAAWIIRSTARPGSVRSVLQSTTSTANAYRSELIGLYGVLAFVNAACKAHGIEDGSVTLACDNLRGLEAADSDQERVPTRRKHSDIIRAIRQVRATLPLQVFTMHVYGHQDDLVDFDSLDLPAQLNTECDALAKSHLRYSATRPDETPEMLPHESIACFVQGQKCTGDVGTVFRNAFSHNLMRDYLLSRRRYWSTAAFEATDWDAVEDCIRPLPELFGMWAAKFMSKFSATNKQLFRIGSRTDPFCPHRCCQEARRVEDTAHIMVCPDPSRREQFNVGVAQVEKWLTAVRTPSLLQSGILRYLRGLGLVTFAAALDHELQYALLATEQDGIGWENFTLGRFSRRFRLVMDHHYQTVGSRRTGRYWAQGLATALLELTHGQWTARNDYIHGLLETGATREEAAALAEDVSAQYLEGSESLLMPDRHLFLHTYEEMSRRPAHEQRQWLVEVEAAREIARIEPEPRFTVASARGKRPASDDSARHSPPKKAKRRARRPWSALEETADISFPTSKRRRGGTRTSSTRK